jgi:hypothetical protein
MKSIAVREVGDDKAAGGPNLHRRQFLVLGAAGLATPLLTQAVAAQERLAAVPPAVPMSIGYVEGTDLAASFSRGAWRKSVAAAKADSYPGRVVPARSLPVGDQGFVNRWARLSLHGSYPRVAPQAGLEAVDLDVLFPSPDPASDRPVPFYAWSYRRRPAPSPSPPVSFVVPVGVDGRLDLALKVTTIGTKLVERAARGAVAVSRTYGASFTVDPSDERPKLQRGLYLLGFTSVWEGPVDLPQAGEKPNLSLLSLAVSVELAPEVE